MPTLQNDDLSIELRYVGGRFDGGKLPLDVLSDLPAFRDLLVAFAKQIWRGFYADRQRVPKGFDKSLAFDLSTIGPGSAIPKLTWDRDAAQAYLPGFASGLHEIVDRSYAGIVDLFDGAANDAIPRVLGSEHVRALNKFGSGLRDHERIEFIGRTDKAGQVVYLDNTRRKALITRVRETYEARFEGTGVLVGVYAAGESAGRITVDTSAHGTIEIGLDRDRVLSEFDGNIGAPVQFDLQIELDNGDRYRSLVELHGVALIDEQMAANLERCRTRMSDLAQLQGGWDEGRGEACDPAAVAAATSFLNKRPRLCSRYKIFPTAAGGVLIEFESNGWDLSAEFLPGGAVELFGIEVDGDASLMPTHFEGVSAEFIAKFDKVVGRNE